MSSPQNRKNRIPVWMIDDNKGFCFALSEALNLSETVECEQCFYSCKSALQALSAEESPPSVVLLDIKMPRMSGLDAITSIKRITPATQIIMLTSFDLDENIRTAINRGAVGYLLKSSTPPEIIDAIEKAQEGGSPIDPAITKRVMEAYLGQKKVNSYMLTSREKDILQCLASELSVQEVAAKLELSYFTVDTHIKNIYQKLHVHTRYGLVTKAAKEKLI